MVLQKGLAGNSSPIVNCSISYSEGKSEGEWPRSRSSGVEGGQKSVQLVAASTDCYPAGCFYSSLS
jgi:hypothetical protein